MAYVSDKYALGICDRTGFQYKLRDLVYQYKAGRNTGLRVGNDVVDEDQPQNFLGQIKINDSQAVKDPRIDRIEPSVAILLLPDPFTTGSSGGGTTTITVNENSHGRLVSQVVRFRDVNTFDGISSSIMQSANGYAIASVVDINNYTITVSATATVGNTKGGGTFASAGPVTLEA
mgnify:FL=1